MPTTRSLVPSRLKKLRLAKIHHLCRNPYGRAEENSNTYRDRMIHKAPQRYLGFAKTAEFLKTFEGKTAIVSFKPLKSFYVANIEAMDLGTLGMASYVEQTGLGS